MTDNSNVLCHCGPVQTCGMKYGLPPGVHAFTPTVRQTEQSHIDAKTYVKCSRFCLSEEEGGHTASCPNGDLDVPK